MTIRSVTRTQAAPADLPESVRRGTSLAGVKSLLKFMKLEVATGRIPPLSLVPPCKHVRSAWCVAAHGTLRVYHAETNASVDARVIAEVARALQKVEPVRPLIMVIAAPGYEAVTLATFAAPADLRHFTFEPRTPLAADYDLLRELVAPRGESGVEYSLRIASGLDTKRVTSRFFTEVRAQRDLVAASWLNIPGAALSERGQLACC